MAVTIRRFEERDIPNKIRWINDSNNNRYLHYDLPLKYEKTLSWYKNNKNHTDRYDAVIEYEGIAVGIIGLLGITGYQAEYYVTLGETEYSGKGIAKKATYLLLDYAFSELKLCKVYLYTEVDNIRGQKLFEHCGFVKTGLQCKSVMNRGQWVDRYVYEIKAAEFYLTNPSKYIDYRTPVYLLHKGLNKLYVKREDLLPVSFGGNKARKARYFFEEIDSGDYDSVVTYGSSSSNHCRIVANMAASRNLPCYIIGPQESSEPTFNSAMMHLFGAEISVVPVEQVGVTIEEKLEELRDCGKKPYFIAGGGHGNPGTQAYVDCYNEILEYEMEYQVHFDYIFFASGTGTTQAGLICGQVIHHDKRKIVGISIARKSCRGRKVVLDSVYDYLSEKNIAYKEDEIEELTIFEDSYTGAGYGEKSQEILQIITEMMYRFGMPLDCTYTAKACSGMQDYIKKYRIEGKSILFIHTGGTPLFFDHLLRQKRDKDL